MFIISANNFLLWKKKQLLKGGSKESLYLLLDVIAGLSHCEINSIEINKEGNLRLRENLDSLESIWEKHIYQAIPIQHLCECTFWRNLKLRVTKEVLIPRPETELIIEIVLQTFSEGCQKLFFAELGTGSGAISIALALAKPLWEGIATDIDKNVIDIASGNFSKISDQNNLRFCFGNWWEPLENFKGQLDLVISNPPYIPDNVYEKLPKEVKKFEPKIALVGGEDGLKHIREIILKAPLYLKEKGWLIMENHFDQGNTVKHLFIENNFNSVEVVKDFCGIGRFTIGRYK